MGTCELCGKNTHLVTARVDGADLQVCSSCGSYGKVMKRPVIVKRPVKTFKPEVLELIVPDYAKIVGNARRKLGVTQKEFAESLNEKESVMQKVESGSFKPSIALARKLEKRLGIKLVEKEKASANDYKAKKGTGLTIGDLIKIKK